MSETIDLSYFKNLSALDLRKECIERGIEFTDNKFNNFFKIIESLKNEKLKDSGVLEKGKNLSYLRNINKNYEITITDVVIKDNIINEYFLRPGDFIVCEVIYNDKNKYLELSKIISVNNDLPKIPRKCFEDLIPVYTKDQIILENRKDDITGQVLDIIVPQGRGQRCLLIAPPNCGKTSILQSILKSIHENYKNEIKIIVLLVDERPEENTYFREMIPNIEVISSTFDASPENHIRVAELVIERSKRLAEKNEDVVLLVDSNTRLTRAYNNAVISSGRVMSGGLEPEALKCIKKFVGVARNTRDGGSITMIATCLTNTGNRQDDLIKFELVGTSNSIITLDQNLALFKVFPAINIKESSTRCNHLLNNPHQAIFDLLKKNWLNRLATQEPYVVNRDFYNILKTFPNSDLTKAMSMS